MAHHEPNLPHTLVDINDYVDSIPDRLRPEDIHDSNDVYVLYAPLNSRMSRLAMRAYVSFDVTSREHTGMKIGGVLSFRDSTLTPSGPSGVFRREIIGGFITHDSANPIVARHRGFKIPVASGILVRGDESFEDELADIKAQLDRDRELVSS